MSEDSDGSAVEELADGAEIVFVVAVAANDVIGADGSLPWNLPEDLRHFKETTMGHPVVMGRRTYDAIVDRLGGPLPGRTNVVLSRQSLDLPDGAVHAPSVEAAIELASEHDETVHVIGGASVCEQFLPIADRLILTELDEAYEGDTYFPEWDRTAWETTAVEEYDEFEIVTYERRDDSVTR